MSPTTPFHLPIYLQPQKPPRFFSHSSHRRPSLFRNLGAAREKWVPPATRSAVKQSTSHHFCFPPPLLERQLLWGSVPCAAVSPSGRGLPYPPSPLLPNSSLSCADGMSDSPNRQAGPPQNISCGCLLSFALSRLPFSQLQ